MSSYSKNCTCTATRNCSPTGSSYFITKIVSRSSFISSICFTITCQLKYEGRYFIFSPTCTNCEDHFYCTSYHASSALQLMVLITFTEKKGLHVQSAKYEASDAVCSREESITATNFTLSRIYKHIRDHAVHNS